VTVAPAVAAWGQPSARWGRLVRILAATDGSPSSTDAVVLAVEMAARHAAALTFVHVAPRADVAIGYAAEDPGTALVHEPTPHDHEILDTSVELAATRGVVAAKVLLAGPPAEEIIAFASTDDFDLVLVGSRGHGAFASAVLGSVSMQVLKACHVPVLVVRGSHRRHDGTQPGEGHAAAR
jgi:nucleotide-binding universal stress UspA family protein